MLQNLDFLTVQLNMFIYVFYWLTVAMSPEQSRRTQRPYRYGMILLCFGALINWVGLAENYTEPIRYAGVACIICGALLICTAMCCWLHTPHRNSVGSTEVLNTKNIQVILQPKYKINIKIILIFAILF